MFIVFSKLSEHHTLRGDLRIPIAVYEKEPSSVIAYTLSSREYARELAKLQSVDKGNKKSLVTSNKAEEMGLTLTEATVNSTSVDAGVDAVAGEAIVTIATYNEVIMRSFNVDLRIINY